MTALAARDWSGALEAFREPGSRTEAVVAVRLLTGRGIALKELGRLPESAAAFDAAASGARGIGWSSRRPYASTSAEGLPNVFRTGARPSP